MEYVHVWTKVQQIVQIIEKNCWSWGKTRTFSLFLPIFRILRGREDRHQKRGRLCTRSRHNFSDIRKSSELNRFLKEELKLSLFEYLYENLVSSDGSFILRGKCDAVYCAYPTLGHTIEKLYLFADILVFTSGKKNTHIEERAPFLWKGLFFLSNNNKIPKGPYMPATWSSNKLACLSESSFAF